MFKFNKFRLNKSNTNKKRNTSKLSSSSIRFNKYEFDNNNNNHIKSSLTSAISNITDSTTMNRVQQGPFSPLSPFSPFSPPNLKLSETSETVNVCAVKSPDISTITKLPQTQPQQQQPPCKIYPKTPIISLIKVNLTDIETVEENTPIAVDNGLPSITSITNRPSTKSSHIIPNNYSDAKHDDDDTTDDLYNEHEDNNTTDYTSFSPSYDESHSVLSTPSSESCQNNKSLSDIPITELITRITEMEEENELLDHGYKFIEKITDTLQGELILAEKCEKKNNKTRGKNNAKNNAKNSNKNDLQRASCIRIDFDKNNEKQEEKEYGVNESKEEIEQVAIKKINKTLYEQRIAESDGMTYCVEENIVKEALILHHLTIDNRSTANYVVRFIEFFETDEHFYLVMEYIDGKTNLKDFVIKAHQYIRDGKLKLKEYIKIIKYLFWQLSAVLYWLHNDMHCCHLDLNLENIMLQNADFVIDDKTGSVSINSAISAKLCDFGRSELFKFDLDGNINGQEFSCQKTATSLDFVQYLSPQLYAEQEYDARLADCWALGMMLYHCCIGQPLYLMVDDSSCDDDDDDEEEDESESIISMSNESNTKVGTGYWAIRNGKLKTYLQMYNLTKYVNNKILDLINNLLKFKESERYQISNVLKHSWFRSYFATYKRRIENKSQSQKLRLLEQKEKLDMFPYYRK